MNVLEKHPFVVLITVFLAAATFFFTVGNQFGSSRVAFLEQELEAYESLGQLELTTLLDDLNTVNTELKENLQISNENSRLREENVALQNQVDELERTNAALTDEITALETAVSEQQAQLDEFLIDSETFTLSEAESRSFRAYELVVGLSALRLHDVDVIVNNDYYGMVAGQSLEVSRNEKAYYLLLNEIHYIDGIAEFTLVIKNANSPEKD